MSSKPSPSLAPQFLWSRLPLTGTPPPPACCHSLVAYENRFLIAFGGGGSTSPSANANNNSSNNNEDEDDNHTMARVITMTTSDSLSNDGDARSTERDRGGQASRPHAGPFVSPRSLSSSFFQSNIHTTTTTTTHTTNHSTPSAFNQVHVFDLVEGRWREVVARNGAVVCPRVSHSAVVYRDRMIVYGGHAPGAPGGLSDVWELNLDSWTWGYIHEAPAEPHGPGARYLHTAHVYQNRMYVLMGKPTRTRAMFWYLNLDDYTWQEVKMPPPSAANGLKFSLVGHAAVVEGGFLYIFGGYYHQQRSGPFPYAPESYSGGVYRYDFERDCWWQPFLAQPIQPPGRYACAMAVKEGRVFVFGGDAHKCTVYYDDFWVLDTTEPHPRWREIRRGALDSGRPSPRSGVAYTMAREALYVLGGETFSSEREKVGYTNELYRYPLRLSTQLSLSENTSRWLSMTSPHSLVASLYFPRLPVSALRILDSYIPRQ